MSDYAEKVIQTADFLRKQIETPPTVGLIIGTGLEGSVQSVSAKAAFAYSELPNFPVSTVQSHAGRLIFGDIGTRPVMIMQGRFHLYEGYSPREVTFPIRVMQQLGVKTLILTNAAGGLNLRFQPGDVMLIRDHINLTGANPLVGALPESWGLRFPDMARAYDPGLQRLTEACALRQNTRLCAGVYAGLLGPSLETPAEVAFLQTIGADAVGFSTIQEVIAAVHAGMRVLGLSTITNINNPVEPASATVEDIIAVAQSAAPRVDTLVRSVVENLDEAQTS
jgi:purine-nucleoside phosphorylase